MSTTRVRPLAAVATALTAYALTACSGHGDTEVAPSVAGGTPVPAVVGHDVHEATRLLRNAGFKVHEVVRLDCLLAQRAEETAPAPGTPVAPGSTIILTYSDASPNASCAYTPEERAWEFLEWADGGARPSRFFTGDLGDPAAPPATWKHATDIAHAAFSVLPTGTGQEQPTVTATDEVCPRTADCNAEAWVDVDLELAGKPYAAFTLLLGHGGLVSGYELTAAPPTTR